MESNVTRDMLIDVGYKWFRQQIRSSRETYPKIFTEVSMDDFLLLRFLGDRLALHESKVYLKDIAAEMMFPMQKVSPMVARLQDRGLVNWMHDKNGTYITISEDGITAMQRQQERLTDFIEKAVTQYGYGKLTTLIQYRSELNDVMNDIVESWNTKEKES